MKVGNRHLPTPKRFSPDLIRVYLVSRGGMTRPTPVEARSLRYRPPPPTPRNEASINASIIEFAYHRLLRGETAIKRGESLLKRGMRRGPVPMTREIYAITILYFGRKCRESGDSNHDSHRRNVIELRGFTARMGSVGRGMDRISKQIPNPIFAAKGAA